MSDAAHDQVGCGVCGDPDGHDGYICPTGLELRAEKAKVATLEARIAELTRERDEWRKAAGTQMCGPNCAHCLYQDERGRAAAARAERDEAAGLLREDMEPKDDAGIADWMRRRDDLVARLAAAPEKETTL